MIENPNLAEFEVGIMSYGKPKVLFRNSGATLRIGKYVSMADDVLITLGGEHRTDWMSTYPFSDYFPEWSSIKGHPATKGDVIIGNDVWIGREALILSGVTIGDGAVIGARAVVAKDVLPYSIVAGNPAKFIRFRFSPNTIAKLTQIAWWNWHPDVVQKAVPFLQANDIDALIKFKNDKK